MMLIKSNKKFIVTLNTAINIFSPVDLSLIKTCPLQHPCKSFELHEHRVFFYNKDGVYCYNIETEEMSTVTSSSRNDVSAICIKDSFIYIGHEDGSILSYTFNEHIFRLNKTYRHTGPVLDIKSDNIKIYTVDIRGRLNVIECMSGSIASFDFVEPRIFIDRYLYVFSENKVYVYTKNAMGFIFDIQEDVQDVVFSPEGGMMFVKGNKSVRCYNSIGMEAGRYFVGNFTVISREGKCYIVETIRDEIKKHETYLNDVEVPEFQFTKMNVKEMAVTGEEYDRRHDYIDDGNKRRMPVNKRKINTGELNTSGINTGGLKDDIENDNNVEVKEQFTNKKKTMFLSESSEYDDLSDSQVQESKNQITQCNDVNKSILYTKKNPSSYENSQANLLLFSSQGYMISLESPLSSQITIKYHDYNQDSIEIKDPLKSVLGSFYDDKYVLSDKKTVQFCDIWKKDLPTTLLGIDSRFIYSFHENILTILSMDGNIVRQMYNPGSYSFCLGNSRIAIFCEDCIMIIKDDDVGYVPIKDYVDFGCFDGDKLFVSMNKVLFELNGRILERITSVQERPLSVFGGNLITLGENTLLPRPVLKYNKIKNEQIEIIKMDKSDFGKYNPYH